MRSTVLIAVLALAVTLVPPALAAPQPVTLTLDWTPNPDHVGFYYAQDHGLFGKAGLDVTIRPPSDPSAALKLVALGKSDLAVTYEAELFYAAAKSLPLVAVAAVVPRPLNSIMSLDPKVRSVADLNGKKIGIAGVPSDYAALDTTLAGAGLERADVTVVNVGWNLLPALLAHKVDAVLGVYRNVEAIELRRRGLKPSVIALERAGIPFYDELVLVASAQRLRTDATYARTVGKFVQAFADGTAAARRDPAGSLAVLKRVTAYKPAFLELATPATLPLLAGPRGTVCLSQKQWQRYGAWMHARGLVKKPIAASAVMTTRFLPARCR